MPSENTLATDQIRNGAITDDKIAAGANIASSKLADGGNFIKKAGTVAFTGDQSMGNNKLTNLQTGSADTDGVNVGQLNSALAGLPSAYKYRNVRVKSTGNVNISNPGTAIFDGVTLSAGDRIVLNDQSTTSQNGIYDFDTSSTALVRSSDSNAWNEITGCLVFVDEGTVGANTRWYCTSNSGGTLGSTAIAYASDVTTSLTTSNFVFDETPSGSINGSNTDFVIANTPTSGSLRVYRNGMRVLSGTGNGYTLSGTTISMTTAPVAGDSLRVDYMK